MSNTKNKSSLSSRFVEWLVEKSLLAIGAVCLGAVLMTLALASEIGSKVFALILSFLGGIIEPIADAIAPSIRPFAVPVAIMCGVLFALSLLGDIFKWIKMGCPSEAGTFVDTGSGSSLEPVYDRNCRIQSSYCDDLLSISEVAKKFGMSQSNIRRVLINRKIVLRKE